MPSPIPEDAPVITAFFPLISTVVIVMFDFSEQKIEELAIN